ncbi:hypothetical protein GRI62_06505 [Erythrobacter arachoides]|uniref:Uncharacterized protein n=1 Tax=Aurantiacibacter arachoides TaxID=1850444 RepID=A0A845A2T3_9SPHN|nr:hypothetical protein [Aurantiacibacter arachoides]MXO93257.1 hypothetical protein [Aurantiacibacter arachoides]
MAYEMAQALITVGKFPNMQERLTDYASRTASEIRRKAAMPMTDIYRRHIQYVEEMWVASGRTLPFVPPVLGSDHDEWFLSGLAERRLAVRRRPSVIALIGETISSPWSVPECPTVGREEGSGVGEGAQKA